MNEWVVSIIKIKYVLVEVLFNEWPEDKYIFIFLTFRLT